MLHTVAVAVAVLLLVPGQSADPEWIWLSAKAEPDQVAHFRKTFTIEGPIETANLAASGDNRVEVYLNGQKVAESDEWQAPARAEVRAALNKRGGENVLAIRAKNEGGAAAVIVRLELGMKDGKTRTIVTDATWLASAGAPDAWEQPGFKAEGWKAAHSIGKLGVAPWGNVLDGKPAGPAAAAGPIKALDGFKVDLLYTVPKEQGSWVCCTFDPKGRLIVSPQGGNYLWRITLGTGEPKLEKIEAGVGGAQGLLWAFDSLYVNGNGPSATAMYRLRDLDGDDRFEKVETLQKWRGGMGEHGPHALLLGPDQKIYCVIGNHVKPPEHLSERSPLRNTQEDHILPRMWDANGHAKGILAPGGYVVRTDAEGKEWEMFCAGFRNEYDAAFSSDGELFTYDSDMEWDIGAPWYRPTRINHCVSGGDYGWRSGSGKWPNSYPDSLPTTLDIGLGSPTGMLFGTRAAFPRRYKEALYAMDWAYGKIYAVHLTPNGATYDAKAEVFIEGKPLNVADMEIGPDGALYFVTGGRGTQSRLYRVTATTIPIDDPPPWDLRHRAALELRRKLESFHGRKDPAAIAFAWPHLNSDDRWIRFAARVAVEHQDVELWKQRALLELRPTAALEALLALARCGGKELLPRLLEALGRLGAPWDKIGEEEKLSLYRCYQVALTRMGPPDPLYADLVMKRFDAVYPAPREVENRELCQVLIHLQAPSAVPKTLALLAKAPTQQEQMHYAFHLRSARTGWTIGLRRQYFEWFDLAAKYKGGNSFAKFNRNARTEAIATLTDEERRMLDPLLSRAHVAAAKIEKRPVVKEWKMEDLLADWLAVKGGRSFSKGREAFARAQCLACHRFGDEGGASGPDVTAASSRFNRRDLLETIVEPSKVISDQYQNTVFQREGGDVVVGRVVKEEGEKITVRPNPLEEAVVELPKKSIRASKPSPVSPMAEGLLNTLTKEEILDLLAYLESGGNEKHANFRK